jgi:hypothetical protein
MIGIFDDVLWKKDYDTKNNNFIFMQEINIDFDLFYEIDPEEIKSIKVIE